MAIDDLLKDVKRFVSAAAVYAAASVFAAGCGSSSNFGCNTDSDCGAGRVCASSKDDPDVYRCQDQSQGGLDSRLFGMWDDREGGIFFSLSGVFYSGMDHGHCGYDVKGAYTTNGSIVSFRITEAPGAPNPEAVIGMTYAWTYSFNNETLTFTAKGGNGETHTLEVTRTTRCQESDLFPD